MKNSISSHYEDFLQEALACAKQASQAQWNTENQHDPGLTTLQILANRLGLVQEHYEALLRKSHLFFCGEKKKNWQASPNIPDALFFHPDLSGPLPSDFKAIPATRLDICSAIRTMPGIYHAWIKKPEGDVPELLVEPAPVLPALMEKYRFFDDDASTHALRKKDLFRQIHHFLTSIRGICQPVLKAREIRMQKLAVELHISSSDEDFSQKDQKELLSFLSDLVCGMEAYWRKKKEPISSLSAASFFKALHDQSSHPFFLLTGLRLGEEEKDGKIRFVQGHEKIILDASGDLDAFGLGTLEVHLFYHGKSLQIPPETLEEARFLADRKILDFLWQNQWNSSEEKEQAFTPAAETTETFPHLFEQFPSCYKLLENGFSGTEQEKQAEILQFQGWLFLLEVLILEMETPLKDPARFFLPEFSGKLKEKASIHHPLLEKLSENFKENYLKITHQSSWSMKERFALLQFLGALQGEKPWFIPEHFESLDEENRLVLLFLWLQKLPFLNARRLVSAYAKGSGQLHNIRPTPLEERLSMLLLPFVFERGGEPLAEQYFFDIRVHKNSITEKNEYRAYIRDEKKNLRMVLKLLTDTPEEAEALACLALRFAELPEHYEFLENGIRIAWIADLVLYEEKGEKEAQRLLATELLKKSHARAISDNVDWVRSILPPWVKVLEYQALGEERPFEIAILVEEELVPLKWREALVTSIMEHVPAHLFARVFFITKEERHTMDVLLYKPRHPDHGETGRRYAKVLEFLHGFDGGVA